MPKFRSAAKSYTVLKDARWSEQTFKDDERKSFIGMSAKDRALAMRTRKSVLQYIP